MREIVTVQVGGGGNAIGQAFLNVICDEHGIDNTGHFCGTNPLQIERINVFFNEGRDRYYARAVAVDTDPESIDKIRKSRLGSIYTPNHYVQGTGGTGNNFAKGYGEYGQKIIGQLINAVRLEAESADSLQGFQIIHAMGGGTGSGLTSLIWEKLIDDYSETMVQTISIIPSAKLSSVVVEPYNCVHCFPHLISNTQLTFCMDNEALYDICMNRLDLGTARYSDANHLIAHAMSGVTTCLRFPGQLNTGLRKLYVNMVPFPNLHFLVPGFAPLSSCVNYPYEKPSVPDLVMQIFSENNMYAALNLLDHKLLTVAAIFRGLVSPKEVDLAMQKVKEKHSKTFVNWIPSNIKTAICDIPPMGLQVAATFIGNTTGITKLINRIDDQYMAMYKRKAYIHWFTEYGMEESQFEEAREKIVDLVQEYESQCQDHESGMTESDCCIGGGKDYSNKLKFDSNKSGSNKLSSSRSNKPVATTESHEHVDGQSNSEESARNVKSNESLKGDHSIRKV